MVLLLENDDNNIAITVKCIKTLFGKFYIFTLFLEVLIELKCKQFHVFVIITNNKVTHGLNV